jgi:formiminoglutamase
MATFTKPQTPLPEPTADDLRIGHLLGGKLDNQSTPDVVIIGFPSDEGVRRNGGRPGAAQGPEALRQAFYKLTPDTENDGLLEAMLGRTLDLGNLKLSGNVEEDQELLGEVLAPFLSQNIVPIILGGGHETAYGHFLGYVKAQQETGMWIKRTHLGSARLRSMAFLPTSGCMRLIWPGPVPL